MINTLSNTPPEPPEGDDALFARMADDLREKGYSIQPNALPPTLAEAMFRQAREDCNYREAGIGRGSDHMRNHFVRRDEIDWITGETPTGAAWLDWLGTLQTALNRRLFLGLFSVESHYAHYAPGAFYKKHLDAFKGQANRTLSLVTYLNPGWEPDDGGELVIYDEHDHERALTRVTPAYATMVIFLSEDFPHEVLPAKRHRYSAATWFRVNGADDPLLSMSESP